jgi:hypothetical protein
MTTFAIGNILNPSATFTRPADTNAYTSGDLVANSTTAGSVLSMAFAVAQIAAGSFTVRRARVKKSGTGVTNASFRLHLYRSDPVALSSGIANGDNGAWSTKNVADYLGSLDVTVDKAFVDGAAGLGIPTTGTDIDGVLASGQTIYGLLEARGTYTPVSAEVFTVELEVTAH